MKELRLVKAARQALILGGFVWGNDMTKQVDNHVYGKQIVILDRGFVYVGDVEVSGDWLVITNASNVRRWGTKKGLGELASGGPTASTQLDPTPTLRAPLRAVIGMIQCEAAKWI